MVNHRRGRSRSCGAALHPGTEFLRGGFPFLPVLIGIFAFAQIIADVEKMGPAGGAAPTPVAARAWPCPISPSSARSSRPVLPSGPTLIGLLIGVLPAIGGSAANIMAYDQAKKFSKHPERFGTGIPEGIIASESSNNSNVAGSLVTIMAFGIPGDAVTAVMLGADDHPRHPAGPALHLPGAPDRLRDLRRLPPRPIRSRW